MASDNSAIFHFVGPIAGFGNDGIMRGEKQSVPALLHNVLQQFECAIGVGGVQITGRFVGQNDARIVCERARDRDTLLFASGKMTAGRRTCRPSLPRQAARQRERASAHPRAPQACASGSSHFPAQ